VLAGVRRGELPHRWVVERAAGDRLADAVVVGVDRGAVFGVARRPLRLRPAVVGAGDALVDLLPARLAHVVDEDAARAGLHREGERVAQAQRPDGTVLARGPGEERVVLGEGAVGVDAEELALEGVEPLRRGAGGLLADADVQLAVLAEVEAA